MAYSVSFNLNPILDSEMGSLCSDDTAQDSLMTQHRTEYVPEGGPETQEMKVLLKEDIQRRDVGDQDAEGVLQGSGSPGQQGTGLLVRNRWSAATLNVLSSMPSRSVGRQNHPERISGYNMQTPGSAPSSRPNVCPSEEETRTQELVNHLQKLSTTACLHILRSTPLSLADKTRLRKRVLRDRQSLSSKVPYWRGIKRGSGHSIVTVLSFLGSARFWRLPLKRLGSRFGTGVLFYFLFLRTVLLFNIFLSLINGLFLVMPQAIYPPQRDAGKHRAFTGLELLTGTGFLSDSVMFYGHYTNSTINRSCDPNGKIQDDGPFPQTACGGASEPQTIDYNMPTAYFFTMVLSFLITCIALVYSLSKSFGRSLQVFGSHRNLANKVFCSWDFKVSKKSSVRIQWESISTQLKELLAEGSRRREPWELRRLAGVTVYPLAWSMCLGSTYLSVWRIHTFAEDLRGQTYWKGEGTGVSLTGQDGLMALPVAVSCVNLFLPGLFNLVLWMENYKSPSVRLYVAIFRNLLLKVSILGVLFYHWLGKVAVIAVDEEPPGLQCWESFVGQELYRFLLVDFLFTVLYTVFGEFLWKLFSQGLLRRKRKPVFDIARNVLELIYGQTLTWLGVLFSPILPSVQVIKLLVLFYMKRNSLLMNFQASRKPWRASHMTTLFISLLCVPSFLGATSFGIYTVSMIKPSPDCGPFRGLPLFYSEVWAHNLTKDKPRLEWLNWVYVNLVKNPLFLFLLSLVFLMVIYVHAHVLDGQRSIMTLLQEQIENEGKDMKFLITKLQSVHEAEPPLSPSRPPIRGTEVPNQHDTSSV